MKHYIKIKIIMFAVKHLAELNLEGVKIHEDCIAVPHSELTLIFINALQGTTQVIYQICSISQLVYVKTFYCITIYSLKYTVWGTTVPRGKVIIFLDRVLE